MGTAYFPAAENDKSVLGAISELDEHARLNSACNFGAAGDRFFARCGALGDRSARGGICDVCIVVLRNSLGLLYAAEGENEGA